MMNYFKTEEMGRLFIKHQEDTYHVLIHHGEPEQRRENIVNEPVREDFGEAMKTNFSEHTRSIPIRSSVEINSSTSATQSNRNEFEVTHPSGVKIKAVVGDIPSYPVDLIVNAANEKLNHIGGLARAIVDKGNYYPKI